MSGRNGGEREMQPDDGFKQADHQRSAIAARLESDIEHLGDRMDKLERSVEGLRADINRHLIERQPTTDRNIQRLDNHNHQQDERITANAVQIKAVSVAFDEFRAEARKDTAKIIANGWLSALGVLLLIGGHLVLTAAVNLFG